MARKQGNFGFAEATPDPQRKQQAQKYLRASEFVKWFAERHREILGQPVKPEPFEKARTAAKLMLDKLGFADAGGRAYLFLKSQRGTHRRFFASSFCFKYAHEIQAIHAEYDARLEQERIDHINFLLAQDRDFGPPFDPNVKQTNYTNRERAKEYSLGELEHLAAQLLERYGTPDAIPTGVKQRLEKAGRRL